MAASGRRLRSRAGAQGSAVRWRLRTCSSLQTVACVVLLQMSHSTPHPQCSHAFIAMHPPLPLPLLHT